MPWYREIRRDQWKVLAAAQLGWMLDAMDVLLYSFALTAIRTEFALSSAAAGALAAVPLVTSAVGGALIGYLSDRYGRARALTWSILTFSFATALTATAHGIPELIVWRAFVGIGLGGEWAAGSVLVAESWPAKHRVQRHRADAIRLGGGIHRGGDPRGGGAAPLGMARAVPDRDSACTFHVVDPAQHQRAGDLVASGRPCR